MPNACQICESIARIKEGTCPYFVQELETGYVILSYFQYFKGYTLFFCKEHKTELHQLDPAFRMQFLKEMSQVAEAVCKAFQPKKLNYELLGNTEPHMHWHLYPRYGTDPNPGTSAWCVDEGIRKAQKIDPESEEFKEYKQQLLKALSQTTT